MSTSPLVYSSITRNTSPDHKGNFIYSNIDIFNIYSFANSSKIENYFIYPNPCNVFWIIFGIEEVFRMWQKLNQSPILLKYFHEFCEFNLRIL
jgi:hypothetical protein